MERISNVSDLELFTGTGALGVPKGVAAQLRQPERGAGALRYVLSCWGGESGTGPGKPASFDIGLRWFLGGASVWPVEEVHPSADQRSSSPSLKHRY